jgi:hypothetical protein
MTRICTTCTKKQFGGGIHDPYLKQWFCGRDCHMAKLEEIIVEPDPISVTCQVPDPIHEQSPTTLGTMHASPPSADSTAVDPPESPQTDTPTPESKEEAPEPPPKPSAPRKRKKRTPKPKA